MADPIVLTESAVILGCLLFFAWWFSPAQRRKRCREEARTRMLLRRILQGQQQHTDRCGGSK